MKARTLILCSFGLWLAAGTNPAPAQSANIPGNSDYDKFSSFITDRNIFDPNRYPHGGRAPTKTVHRTRTRNNGIPSITFVGTMHYEKGLFAFFNANDPDLKKILTVGGEVGGCTVKAITAGNVVLTGADKKDFTMNIGDQLHQDGNAWRLDTDTTASPAAGDTLPAAAETETPGAPPEAKPAAGSADLENNDVLKRLMEKRAKENQ